MTLSTALPRAGQLDCLCEPIEASENARNFGATALLALAFALSVLSQVLSLAILPLAGLSLAPQEWGSSLPYAAFYAGAALASLPASLLLDTFGRRAAFSLGASLGIAGGLMVALALMQWHFGALVLGAFWLGIASGFSLFYRHAAAPLGARDTRSILLVFGAATLAGIMAPTVARNAEALATPHALVGSAIAAALAHVGSLLATAALPSRRSRSAPVGQFSLRGLKRILWPSLIGAVGWFSMTALMGATPIAMVGCGLIESVTGVVAWHVIAMYAPSLALAGLPKTIKHQWMALGGCTILALAALLFALSEGHIGFSASAALLGIGWSLVTLGTTLWIHQSGEPSRWILGLHDASLLGAALVGSLMAGAIP